MGPPSVVPPMDPKNPASPKAKTPPSDAKSQYPSPSGVAAMATTGLLSRVPPIDPKKGASNENTPPSLATVQYPPVWGSAAIPAMGALSLTAPIDPWNWALPKENTPPSLATVQYPPPSAPEGPEVGAMPTIGRLRATPPMDP